MKKILTLLLSSVILSSFAQSKLDLSYYLPKNVTYNKNIPTPKSVIGHEVGEWHITHDKLLYYMKALAKASDRIVIEERGKTYEDRPLILLKITSSNNHNKLEDIEEVSQ